MTHDTKKRQNLARFAGLGIAPGNLVDGITLPGNGKLLVSCAAENAAVAAMVEVKGVAMHCPAGVAGRKHPIGYAEQGVRVAKAAGAPGVVTLYVEGNFGVPVKIAEG